VLAPADAEARERLDLLLVVGVEEYPSVVQQAHQVPGLPAERAQHRQP
jgi:hypothetical protein